MSSILKVDSINEVTSANGVTVDGLSIKDSKLVTADSVVTANITAANVTKDKTSFITTSSSPGLEIKGDGTTDGTIQLNCSQNSHGIKLKSPSHASGASYTLTFPVNDGDANQFLQTNGSGVLSFANGSVPDDAITLAKMAPGTDGNLITYDASGNPAAVATGSAAQVLTSAGAGAVPSFQAATVPDNAITLAKMASGTDGNIISYDASGNPVAVATGNDGQVLTSTGAGSPPVFETPASATNTPMVRAVPSGNQSISSSTNTVVVFNTEIVDSDNAFASNLFTVPSGKAGQYFASATVISNPGVDNALLRVQFVRNVNSSGADVNVCYGNYRTCSDQDETLTVFGIVDLAVADTLRLNYYSYQNGSTIKGNSEYVGGTSINIFKLI